MPYFKRIKMALGTFRKILESFPESNKIDEKICMATFSRENEISYTIMKRGCSLIKNEVRLRRRTSSLMYYCHFILHAYAELRPEFREDVPQFAALRTLPLL